MQAVISDVKTSVRSLGTEYESDGKAMLTVPYPDNSHVNFVQIGVKINADGDTLDMKNIKVFKYWKKSTSSFR